MNKDFNNFDLDYLKKLIEEDSENVSLPDSLKGKALMEKYKAEIASISEETESSENFENESDNGNVIPFKRKTKHYAALAACIALASVIIFKTDFMQDFLQISPEGTCAEGAVEEECPECAEEIPEGAIEADAGYENSNTSNSQIRETQLDAESGSIDLPESSFSSEALNKNSSDTLLQAVPDEGENLNSDFLPDVSGIQSYVPKSPYDNGNPSIDVPPPPSLALNPSTGLPSWDDALWAKSPLERYICSSLYLLKNSND